jgi:hypothetical protein
MKQTLRMFMWGYQPFFRRLLENRAGDVLEQAGANLFPVAILVGVKRADAAAGLPICIEPESGGPTEADFAGLSDEIAERIRNHPDQNLLYGEGGLGTPGRHRRRPEVGDVYSRATNPYFATSSRQ